MPPTRPILPRAPGTRPSIELGRGRRPAGPLSRHAKVERHPSPFRGVILSFEGHFFMVLAARETETGPNTPRAGTRGPAGGRERFAVAGGPCGHHEAHHRGAPARDGKTGKPARSWANGNARARPGSRLLGRLALRGMTVLIPQIGYEGFGSSTTI